MFERQLRVDHPATPGTGPGGEPSAEGMDPLGEAHETVPVLSPGPGGARVAPSSVTRTKRDSGPREICTSIDRAPAACLRVFVNASITTR